MKKVNWQLEIPALRAGFTLIELVVVVGIIGFITIAVISTLNPWQQTQKAHDTRRKADLSQVQRALEQYYQDLGRYPANPGSDCNNSTAYRIAKIDDPNDYVDWGQAWTPYMNILPKDPGSNTYAYIADCDGQSYYIYASLERSTDIDLCKQGGAKCDNAPDDACGGVCNYGVSSPNVSP